MLRSRTIPLRRRGLLCTLSSATSKNRGDDIVGEFALSNSRSILKFLLFVGGLTTLEYLLLYIGEAHGTWPFLQDGVDYTLGRDFLNTWFYGKAAWLPDPGRFYDPATFGAWLQSGIPRDHFDRVWSYPPPFLLVAAPLGLLPYPLALAAWTLLGLLALYLALRGTGPALTKTVIMCSPAVVFCLVAGQISLFAAAIIITALRNMDQRPLLAGLLLALLSVKPQTALLVPVYLVLSQRWRMLAAAVLGGLVLMAMTTAIFGAEIWGAYLSKGIPTQLADARLNLPFALAYSPTIASAAELANLPADAGRHPATSVRGCSRSGFWHMPHRRRRSILASKPRFVLACSVFATPYMLSHDLVAVTAEVVLLAITAARTHRP